MQLMGDATEAVRDGGGGEISLRLWGLAGRCP